MTARLEYLHIDLGKISSSLILPGNDISSHSSRITDNIVRVGVNYKFGGPVVAKY